MASSDGRGPKNYSQFHSVLLSLLTILPQAIDVEYFYELGLYERHFPNCPIPKGFQKQSRLLCEGQVQISTNASAPPPAPNLV